MLVGMLSQRLGEDNAYPLGHEKWKIDISFPDLAMPIWNMETVHLLFLSHFCFSNLVSFHTPRPWGCHVHNKGPNIGGDIPVSS